MLIGLATLIILLFSDGPGEIFLVPDVDKKIRKVVLDDDRRKEALNLFKTTKKKISTYSKSQTKKSKSLKKDTYRASLSQSDIEELLQEYYSDRIELQAYLVAQRLKVREVMNEGEWDNLIEISIQELQDKEKQFSKSQEKRNKEAIKLLDKIQSSLQRNISNESKKQQALSVFAEFEKKIIKVFEETNVLTFENNTSIQKYDVTKEELSGIYARLNEARSQFLKEYIAMRSNMMKFLSEEEWLAISKTFIDLI